jgi:hypothetical protein
MKKLKITFNISEDVVEILEKRVPKGKRNGFIEEAIRFRFSSIEQEQFLRELVRDNKSLSEDLDRIDEGLELGDALLQSDELLDEEELMEFNDLV